MKPKVKLLVIIFITIIAILLVLFAAYKGLYYYTSTTEFCRSCHYIEAYVDTWKNSPHSQVNCMKCHEPQGPMGQVHSKARGLNNYFANAMGNYKTPIINASYINENACFSCHTGQNPDHPNAVKINDSHQHLVYIQENKSCISCHNDVGHETNIGINDIFK